jgi:hypothetical protein
MDARAFYLHIADALSGCQLVEQELKLYISEALELVQKCVGGRVPFNMTGEDYEDSSLERLIETFKKLSDNPTLVLHCGSSRTNETSSVTKPSPTASITRESLTRWPLQNSNRDFYLLNPKRSGCVPPYMKRSTNLEVIYGLANLTVRPNRRRA